MTSSFANLPTGTVTFLFTDIEGSTNLAQQYPEALPTLLARHHNILRQAIDSNHGIVFRMAGDAFCAAFRTPGDGLAAALAAQRELQRQSWEPAPVLVRMGLHTGEAYTRAAGSELDPYVGYLTLTRVQRVMSTANGGQILVSDATAALMRSTLPPEVSLRDMGEHKLKGLANPEPLWQIVAPDLRQDFAPLQTLQAVPSNLPGSLNRMIGRTRELQELKKRLAGTRLLTLLGPGGTGKTRLALQVAKEVSAEFEDRVYFVDLATSRDSEAVLGAIGRTVGLREKNDKPLLAELKGHIKQTKMLALLDNFEQVTVAAPTMAELLRDCPELKMLVTSREALHVRAEQVFPVPPLTLPRVDSKHLSLEQLAQCEAIQLFLERARAVRPDLELTNENAQTIAEICLRLDGLPLAIELATARLNMLTPQALLDRLSNRLKLLRGGASDLPARHQTLRDTIDWSYEMLDPVEQALFKFLAVFSGATLEAIEAVASRLEHPDELGVDIFEGVSSLGDKSLLRMVEGTKGESRFQMLETIREFASARLDEDARLRAAARRAHATWFADFTFAQWGQLNGDGRDAALERLTRELDNIKSAWRYWADEGNLEQLGKFTDTLWLLYDTRGWYYDTVQLTTELLRVLGSAVSTPERAREEIVLQMGLARALLATKGYTEGVEQAYARALELCEIAGEIPQLYSVLRGLSTFYILRADPDKGLEMGKRILELAERLDDTEMQVAGNMIVGENIASLDDLKVGLEYLEKAIVAYDPNKRSTTQRGLGGNPGVISLMVSALFLWMRGYPERALKRAGDAIRLAHQLDHPFSLAYARYHNAFLALWLGDHASAGEHARVVMDLADEYEFRLWGAAGACVRGAALVEMGSVDQGLGLIKQGLTQYRGPKSPPVFLPLLLALNARAYMSASRPAQAVPLLDEALQIASTSKGKSLGSEFLILKGELVLALSPENTAEAETWFQTGIQFAQAAGGMMLELRAAMPLSRLWQAQGKTDQAHTLLQNAYAQLTEGFEMPDLKQARALLTELSREVQ